jgi:DNA primase
VQAAKKALEILLAEDLEVKILVLPDNSDPDEFIRKAGVSEYQRQRGEAQPHIQFLIDQAVRGRNLSNPVDKDAALEEVLPYVYEVKSSIQQHEYFVLVMDRFKVPPSERRRYSQRIREKSGLKPKLSLKARSQANPTPAERRLVRLLLNDEELRSGILNLLEPEDYEGLATEPIFRVLFELEQIGTQVDFHTISARLEELEVSIDLPPLFFSDSLHAEEKEFTAEKCVDSFRLMSLDRRIDELNASMANAERAKDSDEVARLSIEHVELSKRRSALLPKADGVLIGN